MSRLIDADALIEEIANMDISEQSKIFSVNMLRYTPTAYDISKVVEELEELKEKSLSSYDYETMKIAIDIVKRGGVEWDVNT